MRQDRVNQLFNPGALFLFLFTGATWHYHAIHKVFTYFASFTGYEDEILEVSYNLHVQESKFGGKIYKFGGKSFKNLTPMEFMEFVFSKSAGPWPGSCQGNIAGLAHQVFQTPAGGWNRSQPGKDGATWPSVK